MEKITIKASDGLLLSAFLAEVDAPKGFIQIVHGMVEHKERYEYFISKLNEAGYSVLIADLRGHGESINDNYTLGHIGSINQMIDDEHVINQFIKSRYNGEIYMFAHSMGSLIARSYLTKYDTEITKLILSGTVAYMAGCGLGVFLAKNRIKRKGPRAYSKLLFALSNNASTNESKDWLSYNEENITKYVNDPLCSFYFTNYSNYVLFQMTKKLHANVKCQNPNLKIISLTGADDRTTNGTKGVVDSIETLKKRGYLSVDYKEYPHMKHETLNEDDRDKVIEDVIKFYDKDNKNLSVSADSFQEV